MNTGGARRSSTLNMARGCLITILYCMSTLPGWMDPLRKKGGPCLPAELPANLGMVFNAEFEVGPEARNLWDPFWLCMPGDGIHSLPVNAYGRGTLGLGNEPRMERVCHIMGKDSLNPKP